MAWKRRLRALSVAVCFCGGLVWLRASLHAAEPLSTLRSTSQSGAFVGYSSDRSRRSRMLQTAEKALTEWRKIVDPEVGSASPIILQDKSQSPRPRGSPALVTAIFETEGGGMKVQVDILDANAMRGGAFEVEIYRALVLHAMHSKNPPRAGQAYTSPPSWFVEGLVEDLRRKESGVPDGVYGALIRSDSPPNLAKFLKQKSEILDATSLLLYRAQALAMLRVLQKAREGKPAFASLLASPDFAQDDVTAVRQAFPSLGDAAKLSKIWTLALARSSMPAGLSSLTVKETDAKLTAILDLGEPTATSKPSTLPALMQGARGEGGAYLMRQRSVELFDLEFRGHPLLRPVVGEYREIMSLLARKPKAKLAQRIADIEKIRALLVERHQKITDYLNWFEATQIDTSDAPLLDQVKAAEPPLRTDPYALELDRVEQCGW